MRSAGADLFKKTHGGIPGTVIVTPSMASPNSHQTTMMPARSAMAVRLSIGPGGTIQAVRILRAISRAPPPSSTSIHGRGSACLVSIRFKKSAKVNQAEIKFGVDALQHPLANALFFPMEWMDAEREPDSRSV